MMNHENLNGIPVLLICFNRPSQTQITFRQILNYNPSRIYVAIDGPRKSNKLDLLSREEILKFLHQSSDSFSSSNVVILDRAKNLGCRKSVNDAISWVFEEETKLIILEDDCVPRYEFFKFMEWGLNEFERNSEIGMISGSNLIDYKTQMKTLNGFSNYINIWGWGTWKRVWELHDTELTIPDIQKSFKNDSFWSNLSILEKHFWKELLKMTVYFNNTWDFQLQFTFFRNNLLSVYPANNLVENIGFLENATHTTSSVPDFVKKSTPKQGSFDMSRNIDMSFSPCKKRDKLMLRTIWNLSLYSALRLKLGNIYRMLR